jgi:hypothetical protein
MGQDRFNKVSNLSDFKLESFVRSIRTNESASPMVLKHVKQFCSIRVLANRETRPNLPAEAMSLARNERDAEAAFAIYKPRDVGCKIHGKSRAGVLQNRKVPSRVSQTLSRYGEHSLSNDLTLGITRDGMEFHREGFTDLSRLFIARLLVLGAN